MGGMGVGQGTPEEGPRPVRFQRRQESGDPQDYSPQSEPKFTSIHLSPLFLLLGLLSIFFFFGFFFLTLPKLVMRSTQIESSL